MMNTPGPEISGGAYSGAPGCALLPAADVASVPASGPEMQISFLGTGAGMSVTRAHTAIAVRCPDGTMLLLDAGSGNSALRNGQALGISADQYDAVLLSHDHPDHLTGLFFVQSHRAFINPEAAPLPVYGTRQPLRRLVNLARHSRLQVHQPARGAAQNSVGREVLRWQAIRPGRPLELGPRTVAWAFPVDHTPEAVGWRVECDGLALVFSGDTRFSPQLTAAAAGAGLLIHEAMCLDEQQPMAAARAHSTAGEAARAAHQSGAARLLLTHIDNPYHESPQPLAEEAAAHYQGLIQVAYDRLQIALTGG